MFFVNFRAVIQLTFALVLMLPAVALAAPGDDDRAIARKEYVEGTREFELGHFDEAIKHYEEAYRHRDNPVLLYNLAQAHRLAGHNAQGLRLYKQYLMRVPDAANREEVSQKIALLEKLIESERMARSMPPEGAVRPGDKAATEPPPVTENPPPPATTPPPPATTTPATTPPPREAEHVGVPGRGLKIAGIVVAAVGIGALAGGIAMGVLTQKGSDAVAAEAKAGQHFDPAQESKALTDQTVEIALLAAGGAALVGGVVIYYLGWRQGAREGYRKVVLLPTVGPNVAALTLEGHF